MATAESLLDGFLSRWEVSKRHAIVVAAPAATVFAAVRDLDLGRSPVIRKLFRWRGLPASALRLEGMERLRFVRLAEVENQQIVFGGVGKFWTPSGNMQRLAAAEFRSFDDPRFAKAVWNFEISPSDGRQPVELATETRIHCPSTATRLLFRLYWVVVGPLSGWVRKEMLRLAKEDAEAVVRGSI